MSDGPYLSLVIPAYNEQEVIPMLLQRSTTPGATVGLNGLSGNLGIAVAAALTGLTVTAADLEV